MYIRSIIFYVFITCTNGFGLYIFLFLLYTIVHYLNILVYTTSFWYFWIDSIAFYSRVQGLQVCACKYDSCTHKCSYFAWLAFISHKWWVPLNSRLQKKRLTKAKNCEIGRQMQKYLNFPTDREREREKEGGFIVIQMIANKTL